MKSFFCQADDGSDDGAYVTAGAPQYAAEAHAERMYNDSAGECGDAQVIRVRDELGTALVFDVSTDWSPTFIARERGS